MRDIRIIPIVLCLLAFIAAYGPWSAFAVSERSQVGRLEAMLGDAGALSNGTIQSVAGKGTLSDHNRRELSSVISYLCFWHGTEPFHNLLTDSARVAVSAEPAYDRPSKIASMIGFEIMPSGLFYGAGAKWFSINISDSTAVPIDGYTSLINYQYAMANDTDRTIAVGDDSLTLHMEPAGSILRVYLHGSGGEQDSVAVAFGQALELPDTLVRMPITLPVDRCVFEETGTLFDIKAVLLDARGNALEDRTDLSRARMTILFRRKAS